MIRVTIVRFFGVVSPVPAWMRAAIVAATAIALVTLWFNPREVDAALGTILLLQMFAASNGYVSAASCGYFDPVLIGGRRRERIAAANLVSAALPGLASWGVVVMVASVLGQASAVLSPRRLLAIAVVSCVGWTAGLAMPRLAAGALWSLILVALALSRGPVAEYLRIVQNAPASLADVLSAAGVGLVCPFLLLSDFPAMTDRAVLAIDATVCGAVAACGIRYVSRLEYVLGERS